VLFPSSSPRFVFLMFCYRLHCSSFLPASAHSNKEGQEGREPGSLEFYLLYLFVVASCISTCSVYFILSLANHLLPVFRSDASKSCSRVINSKACVCLFAELDQRWYGLIIRPRDGLGCSHSLIRTSNPTLVKFRYRLSPIGLDLV
jgi:hypothetical protein